MFGRGTCDTFGWALTLPTPTKEAAIIIGAYMRLDGDK